MFINNKYTKWYFSLVNKGSKIKPNGYSEKHHIIPKSLGGSNSITNLIYLSARQHYIAHLLLVKMTKGLEKRSMTHAMIRFAGKNQRKGYKISSKLYEIIRNEYSLSITGKNNPMYGIPCCYKMTVEEKESWLQNVRNSLKGDKNPFYGKKHSDETKKHIGEKNSQQIKVTFIDGSEKTFQQYGDLGTYLKMSRALGSKLCKHNDTFKHLWIKYNIRSIEKL
jgi:hypothetical protein